MQIKRMLLNNPPKIKLFKVNKKKHWKKVSNMFKVNHENTRITSVTWFWCFC